MQRTRFYSQNPHGALQVCNTTCKGSDSLFCLCGHQPLLWCTSMYSRQALRPHKINTSFKIKLKREKERIHLGFVLNWNFLEPSLPYPDVSFPPTVSSPGGRGSLGAACLAGKGSRVSSPKQPALHPLSLTTTTCEPPQASQKPQKEEIQIS